MPEAAVYEEGDPVAREYEIGFARQIPPVKSEPQTHGVRQATNSHFGRGVF